MTLRRPLALAVVPALLTLAACATGPAGERIDSTAAGFGNATMQNRMIQSGDTSYVVDLTRRFAASVPPRVNFAFNSAALDAEARAILDRQADFIRQFPELRFRVYGHTDLVGSNAYNRALGLRRAQAVVGYLSTRGISRRRLEAVVSYGETQPLVLTEAPNAQNRRTVTEVSGFVGHRQGTPLNGKYAEVIFRDYIASGVTNHAQPTWSGGTSNLGGDSGSSSSSGSTSN
ncbi:OmpA family protein [Frigidibacter sp. MR17.24]|uniref:OmpA family protein n=1 Tax=Frigidibacter sp. MR17.24 TaxID=3127345 RepID=UPI003012E4F0